MPIKVVSPERALSEGTTPDELALVAEWHEERADVIGKVLKKGKNRAFGDFVSDQDRKRHIAIARSIRSVITQLERLHRDPKSAAA